VTAEPDAQPVAEPGPAPAAEAVPDPVVELRPVATDADYAAYRTLALDEHAAEFAHDGRLTLERARELVAFGLPETLAELLATDRTSLFQVVADDNPVGWLWLGPSPRDPDCVMVFDVRIERAHQGAGLGRAAMLAAEAVVRDAGFSRIGLQVLGWNQPAETLYRSLGYQVDATTMSKPVTTK
jgi:GNAT superfamily N-acetyltransferase